MIAEPPTTTHSTLRSIACPNQTLPIMRRASRRLQKRAVVVGIAAAFAVALLAVALPPPPLPTAAAFSAAAPATSGRRRCCSRHSANTAVPKAILAVTATTESGSDDSSNGETAILPLPAVSSATTAKTKRKVAVLVCPAQFCVPVDYDGLFVQLRQYFAAAADDDDDDDGAATIALGTCRVAPLPRTEWIKVARQLPTAAFFRAQLPVERTLRWYFAAMDAALAEIFAADGADVSVCVVGHSMGGWVARAYLGGLSLSSTAVHGLALQQITSLVTLGTPHTSPAAAVVDQTRGLLAAIAAAPSCTPRALVAQHQAAAAAASLFQNTTTSTTTLEITCVCSSAVPGNFFTRNVEQIIAAGSYFPQTGWPKSKSDDDDDVVVGDGIVPLALAFLDAPARRVELTTCSLTAQPIRHLHVLPTPWNLADGSAPSIPLPADAFPSYVTPGVVPQWARYIR